MRKKIVVVVEDGMVQSVFTDDPNDDVEVIDLDSDELDEDAINALQDRVNTVSQYLVDHLG